MMVAKLPRHFWPAAAVAYGAMAIITYGHSASRFYRAETAGYEACQAERKAGKAHHCYDGRSEEAATIGIIAGMLWPLYWSWELQQ